MMKRMTRTGTIGLVMLGLSAPPLAAQRAVVSTQSCESGVLEGHLGIAGLDCVGECSVTMTSEGKEERWIFSTEPRIFNVEEGGPSEGIFQPGDRLVAIDGVLITTREGGRRYANLVPGEVVRVRYRRDGVIQEAGIRVGSRCRPNPPEPAAVVGRVPPPPPPLDPDEPRALGIATAPRVRVLPDAAVSAPLPPLEPAVAGTFSSLSIMGSTPRGRLGIGFSCSDCGTTSTDEEGRSIWFFSGPLEVTQVNAGGPAEEAGIRLGDMIRAIDGHDMTTDEGGLAFSTLTPGEAVEVTLVRRNGREETVTLVPGETEPRAALGIAAPPPRPAGVREPRVIADPAPPARPDRVAAPEPGASVMTGPTDLPLSYSGSVAGVEVAVRGGPVSVAELHGTRTLIIYTDDIWIRIRVPAGTGTSGGGGEEIR